MAREPVKSLLEKGNEFHSLMGNCISTWATIEQYLFKICRESLGSITIRAAIVYYRTPTIDARRTLVDELVRTVLPSKNPPSGGHDHPDVDEWKEIYKEMGELLRVRNRIAHQPIGPRMEFKSESATGSPELWFEIYMSEHESARKGEPPKALRKEDLQQHASAVWELKERLAAFYINTLPKYVSPFP
jgi:hypothetical protein